MKTLAITDLAPRLHSHVLTQTLFILSKCKDLRFGNFMQGNGKITVKSLTKMGKKDTQTYFL